MQRNTIKNNAPYVYLEQDGSQFTLRVLIHLDGTSFNNVDTSNLPNSVTINLSSGAGSSIHVEPISIPVGGSLLTVKVNNNGVVEETKIEYSNADDHGILPSNSYVRPYLFLKNETSINEIVPYVTLELNGYRYGGEAISSTTIADSTCDILITGIPFPSSQGDQYLSNLRVNSHSYDGTGLGNTTYCAVTVIEYDDVSELNTDIPDIYQLDGSIKPTRRKRKAKIKNIHA